tara:strand:+ start:201 stop:476 length:276 start_codon:yes stop_codon:yes gene_type:complete
MYQFFYKTMLAHPADINESYLQHLSTACGFAARLLLAALACFVHALIPCLFARTASNSLNELHREMYENRAAKRDQQHTARDHSSPTDHPN